MINFFVSQWHLDGLDGKYLRVAFKAARSLVLPFFTPPETTKNTFDL